MTRREYSPEIKSHPWMTNVVCNRPAGYKTIDNLSVDEITRWIARLNAMANKLRGSREVVAFHDSETIDVVGLVKMQEALQAMERYSDIVDDCVYQWVAHEFPEESQ